MPIKSAVAAGTLVSYQDMANPKRVGIVVEVRSSRQTLSSGVQIPQSPYGIRWENGTFSFSSLGQHGWSILS